MAAIDVYPDHLTRQRSADRSPRRAIVLPWPGMIALLLVMVALGSGVLLSLSLASAGLWSSGGRLVYSGSERRWTDIYMLDVDRGIVHNLSANLDLDIQDVAWSPDGRQMVFVAHGSQQSQLYLMEVAGLDIHLLLGDPEFVHFSPAWSETGDSIIFFRRIGPRFSRIPNPLTGTYSINPDGSGLQQLGKVNLEEADDGLSDIAKYNAVPSLARVVLKPPLSPDQTHTANIAFRETQWVLETRNVADRADIDQLAVLGIFPGEQPVWSPAGDWLAYLTAVPGRWQQQIFLIDRDGSTIRRLTNDLIWKEDLVWLP